MTQHRIHIHAFLVALIALSAGALATDALAAGTKSHAAPKPKAEPAKPAGEPIEYAALETRVGETISVDTTFHTTRTGKLIKWTQPALTVQMGTEANPIVLTVPKETIKSIMLITPPAAEPAKDAGTSGAKKN
jgi:hypothetical protein